MEIIDNRNDENRPNFELGRVYEWNSSKRIYMVILNNKNKYTFLNMETSECSMEYDTLKQLTDNNTGCHEVKAKLIIE